jgi:hypothetical protein
MASIIHGAEQLERRFDVGGADLKNGIMVQQKLKSG